MPDTDRCTGGHCCRLFYLPYSPEELAENYRAWRVQEPKDRNGHNQLIDIHLIAPMVRYAGLCERSPWSGETLEKPSHYYRCAHLSDQGDCQIYDIRPQMCRVYPNGRECTYHGCTSNDARAGRIDRDGERIEDPTAGWGDWYRGTADA